MKTHMICFLILMICISGMLGCYSKESIVVLLPDNDGKVGNVSISNSKGIAMLDKARQSVSLRINQKPARPAIMPQNEFDAILADAIEIQPLSPVKFILYFLLDSNELTQESKSDLDLIKLELKKRVSPSIIVSGHSDTSGSEEMNFKLSKKRAFKIRNILIENGISPTLIEVTSHGETMLLVQTEDNVKEALNRRVEVIVQ